MCGSDFLSLSDIELITRICKIREAGIEMHHPVHDHAIVDVEEHDPVRGMSVDPSKAATSIAYDGTRVYFCSLGCAAKFRSAPETYIQAKQDLVSNTPGAKAGKGIEFTCPMHPEIKETDPGNCPKCGMALEPVTLVPPTRRTEYTCPMHPQIVRDTPGSCPLCGMALEPREVTVDASNPELDAMSSRLWISVAFSVPMLG